ncbi:hypothetical protein EAG_06089 [Camponotus floridanus]|uniref:Uncharacterized protein n=1 Tax=Camponotus floridanus TaxID=104421 RepID=E2A5E1_CAMFO|nr:hypothetical protein EAG_06089 [Camponotus floridanus]
MVWCGRHAREAAWDCAARANAAARESTGCDAGGTANAALGRRRNYEIVNFSSGNDVANEKRERTTISNEAQKKRGQGMERRGRRMAIGKSCHLAESCVHTEQCPYYLFYAAAIEARHGKYSTQSSSNQIRRFWLVASHHQQAQIEFVACTLEGRNLR